MYTNRTEATKTHILFMEQCIALEKKAMENGDFPVGSISDLTLCHGNTGERGRGEPHFWGDPCNKRLTVHKKKLNQFHIKI